MRHSSIPANVAWADQKDLKLSIGRIRRLINRWSCSTMLFKCLHWRILMRLFWSVLYCLIAVVLAPLLSILIKLGLPVEPMAGGAVGAASGAILSESVGEWGGVGAVYGAAKSGLKGDREQSQVVKRCMRGRGYRVLN